MPTKWQLISEDHAGSRIGHSASHPHQSYYPSKPTDEITLNRSEHRRLGLPLCCSITCRQYTTVSVCVADITPMSHSRASFDIPPMPHCQTATQTGGQRRPPAPQPPLWAPAPQPLLLSRRPPLFEHLRVSLIDFLYFSAPANHPPAP